MIGCPKGEGGHLLAVMISMQDVSENEWLPSPVKSLTCFKAPGWNVTHCSWFFQFTGGKNWHQVTARKASTLNNCFKKRNTAWLENNQTGQGYHEPNYGATWIKLIMMYIVFTLLLILLFVRLIRSIDTLHYLNNDEMNHFLFLVSPQHL